MQKLPIILLSAAVVLGAGYAVIRQKTPVVVPVPVDTGQVICTMEAKLCPDGSYVGRTGPHCEFAACPTATTTQSGTVTLQAAIAQTVSGNGVSIVPLQVLEDSRCPTDVQCIQAGAVRLKAQI